MTPRICPSLLCRCVSVSLASGPAPGRSREASLHSGSPGERQTPASCYQASGAIRLFPAVSMGCLSQGPPTRCSNSRFCLVKTIQVWGWLRNPSGWEQGPAAAMGSAELQPGPGAGSHCVYLSPSIPFWSLISCLLQSPRRPCGHTTLHGTRDFADVTQVRILRWGNYPGLSGQAQCNHVGSYKREAGVKEKRRPCADSSWDCSDAATSQTMLAASRSWTSKGTDFPPEPSGGTGCDDTLVSGPQDSLWTSDFQNSKTMNMCCFKLSV